MRFEQSLSAALAQPLAGLAELDRLDCEESLAGFIKRAWHVIEPGQPYVHGWHIEAVADHLEAITNGQITRLLINVPPGTMKSLATSVFWPAWEWGPRNLPSTRIVATSHSIPLAVRDNTKMRRLVQSEWYQDLWGDRVKLTGDQNAKTKFENTKTGFRDAMAFKSLTGSRGDRVIIDDPLSVDGAASEVEREGVNTTFLESVPTRLNNPDRSAIVVIMQRLHERDVSGIIIARELGYEHLMLPMEYEPDRRCRTVIGFKDPRTERGELLFPARFSREVVERDKRVMGSYATAGQFQQRPAPREGGLFKKRWFDVVGSVPTGVRRVRRWDLAATERTGANNPDWTVGVLMARDRDGVFYIEDIERLQGSPQEVERTILATASRDGKSVEVALPQDPGQAGKVQVQYLTRQLAGYVVRPERETGSKVTRAEPMASQAEAGNIKIVEGRWNDAFFDELDVFPNGAHDDQVDACGRRIHRAREPAEAYGDQRRGAGDVGELRQRTSPVTIGKAWAAFTRPWRAQAGPMAPAAPKPRMAVSDDVLSWSKSGSVSAPSPFVVAKPPTGVIPSGAEMAMDDNVNATMDWASSGLVSSYGVAIHEGLAFLGYPYLAELAQRPEYRRMNEVIARHMTREWIELQAVGEDDKTDRIARIEEAMKRLNVREAFRKAAELDCAFGRAHVYLDLGKDEPEELKTSIGDGWNEGSRSKVAKGGLKRLTVVEPVWSYPAAYDSNNPLSPDWYRPRSWYVMGKEISSSRLLTFVGREVPDLLKPAYSFGGLSLSQMAKPYVDNWIKTRQGVADIVSSFSVFNLATNMTAQLNAENGAGLFRRAALFNNLRDNRGLLITDKESEEFNNISAPLGTLDVLQAQTQEHMCTVSGIPVVLFTGISPAGLNASSEGELRAFYDWIHAEQEIRFRLNLTKVLGFVMLSEFGEVDPDITFKFVPLWSLSEKEIAEKHNIEAQTDGLLIENGVIAPHEARNRVASDPDTAYAGLAIEDVPLPAIESDDPPEPDLDAGNDVRLAVAA